MVIATQKLSYKASCKTPFFLIMISMNFHASKFFISFHVWENLKMFKYLRCFLIECFHHFYFQDLDLKFIFVFIVTM
jgi:hypothetical protein